MHTMLPCKASWNFGECLHWPHLRLRKRLAYIWKTASKRYRQYPLMLYFWRKQKRKSFGISPKDYNIPGQRPLDRNMMPHSVPVRIRRQAAIGVKAGELYHWVAAVPDSVYWSEQQHWCQTQNSLRASGLAHETGPVGHHGQGATFNCHHGQKTTFTAIVMPYVAGKQSMFRLANVWLEN